MKPYVKNKTSQNRLVLKFHIHYFIKILFDISYILLLCLSMTHWHSNVSIFQDS